MNRMPLIVANWKMNHGVEESIIFASKFLQGTFPENVEIVICPPFTSLYTLSVTFSDTDKIKLGAQNCHHETSGAFTGEISPAFLEEISCQYVLIGHSERRHVFNESDEFLLKKINTLLETSLKIIFCIGETLEQREAGKTFDVIDQQLHHCLGKIDKNQLSHFVIAYEPVWAIGTGKTATPEQAQEVHHKIRTWIHNKFGTLPADAIRILYGGSVKPNNTKELMLQEDIDGLLVGGASLDPVNFNHIIRNAVK